MKFSYHRFKNRVKDTLVKMKSRHDLSHTEQYQEILKLVGQLSEQEKESLHLEIRRQLEKSGQTIEYAESIFVTYSRDYLEHAGSLKAVSILELGPGTNLAAGFYFLLAGASRYVAVDALAAFPDRPKEFYRQVIEEIKRRPLLVGRTSINDSDIDSIVQIGSTCVWNQQRLQYLTPVFVEKIPQPDESFDYIFSNASFEHFENPERVISEVYRLLKPGGLTVHTIDLRDHNDFEKPLEFLKISQSDYRFTSPYGTNRWRVPDFKDAFEKAGFKHCRIDITERRENIESELASLDRFFTESYSRADLEILGIKVYAKK